jgi:hypothetical protein
MNAFEKSKYHREREASLQAHQQTPNVVKKPPAVPTPISKIDVNYTFSPPIPAGRKLTGQYAETFEFMDETGTIDARELDATLDQKNLTWKCKDYPFIIIFEEHDCYKHFLMPSRTNPPYLYWNQDDEGAWAAVQSTCVQLGGYYSVTLNLKPKLEPPEDNASLLTLHYAILPIPSLCPKKGKKVTSSPIVRATIKMVSRLPLLSA